MKRFHLLILLTVLLCACEKETEDTQVSDSTMEDFALQKTDGSFSVKALGAYNGVITICVPRGTDLSNMKATFRTGAREVLVGETVQESGVSVNDFNLPVTYTLKDASGAKCLWRVTALECDHPVIYIRSPYPETVDSRDHWTVGCRILIWSPDGSVTDETIAKMRQRGNATMRFPKKAYALKFEKKQPVLGMPSDKRWDLLANWRDVTKIRNSVGMEISRRCPGLAWTPRSEFCELIMNSTHQGLYQVFEHIKIDPDRVNITEMTANDNAGEALSGGYLLELDSYFDETNQFRSPEKDLPYIVKEPSDLTKQQSEYIRNYVATAEKNLYSDNWKSIYRGYFDIDSFIDYWFVFELTESTEGQSPHSFHLYKDRNGKLIAGPVWDFDFPTFIPDKTSFVAKDAIYYGRFFSDKDFIARVKEKWTAQKEGFKSIPDYIDRIAEEIDFSAERDYDIWPIIDSVAKYFNGDEHLSHDDAVELLKKTYIERFNWLDKQIDKL